MYDNCKVFYLVIPKIICKFNFSLSPFQETLVDLKNWEKITLHKILKGISFIRVVLFYYSVCIFLMRIEIFMVLSCAFDVSPIKSRDANTFSVIVRKRQETTFPIWHENVKRIYSLNPSNVIINSQRASWNFNKFNWYKHLKC